MPEENIQAEENFSKKKVGVKKTATIRKKPVVKKIEEEIILSKPDKKPTRMVNTRGAKKESNKDKELNERLSSIYRDQNGKIPNMREIKVKKGHPVIRGFFTLLIVGGLMALTAWVGFFYLPGSHNKSDKQVDFYMEGPTRTDIGATTTYKIVFKNKVDLTMKNAVISINYPENFVFYSSSLEANNPGHTEWRVGDLAPNKSGELTITGFNYNEPNTDSSWRVFINYMPENFNSEMQEIFTLKTTMNRPEIDFSLTGPEKTLLGDETAYSIKLKFPTDFSGNTLKVIPNLPQNFTITSSSPKMEKDGSWLLIRPTDEQDKEQELVFMGRFGEIAGSETLNSAQIVVALAIPREDKDFNVAEKNITTTLEKNTYSASLAINGSMTDLNSRPGEILNMTAQFKNTGSETYKNAEVKIVLDSPALNNKSCLNWGAATDEFDGDVSGTQLSDTIRRGQITWDKDNVPELAEIAAGQTVEVDFQIPVQNTDSFDMSALKAFVINASLEVAYTDAKGQDKDVFGNKMNITLNSDLTLDARNRKVTDDGVEKRQITWLLNNNFHPLKNVRVIAEVFGQNQFVMPTEIPAGKVSYDETTKKITWIIEDMPLELDAAGLTFDILVKNTDPTQKSILGKTSLSAEDTVTGQTIYLSGDEVGI